MFRLFVVFALFAAALIAGCSCPQQTPHKRPPVALTKGDLSEVYKPLISYVRSDPDGDVYCLYSSALGEQRYGPFFPRRGVRELFRAQKEAAKEVLDIGLERWLMENDFELVERKPLHSEGLCILVLVRSKS